jgi:hypothetical protein
LLEHPFILAGGEISPFKRRWHCIYDHLIKFNS